MLSKQKNTAYYFMKIWWKQLQYRYKLSLLLFKNYPPRILQNGDCAYKTPHLGVVARSDLKLNEIQKKVVKHRGNGIVL